MLSSDISWQHSTDTTHQHPVYPSHPHPTDWDMSFTATATDYDTSSSTVLPVAEPAYDLFSTNPQHASFRFRSDSSSSEADNASPSYLYQQPSRPSTSYSAAPTIAPDAIAPPSLSELMMDSSRHSSVSASAPSDLSFGYQQQQQQAQPQAHRNFSFDASGPLVRPTLRPSNTFPSSAFPTMPTDTMIKREEAPYHFTYPTDGHDVHSYVRPHLDRYITSPNRSAAGECSIIVMSSKVAQKSYGTEKRFLCPPPTAIMIGNNWWSENRRGDVVPPKAVISISGEPSPLESLTEWSTPAGKNFDINEAPLVDRERGSTTFMGRCIGKQLFISDVDERKKKVEALVKVVVPADDPTLPDPEPERLIGVFPSKPIKVISKPSKKRQSAKNLELCINHGSTVSLFHRLRAQTVSTKYLCVSGSSSAFKGSDGQSLPGTVKQNAPPSFVAKTACWESFVIYIIDLNKPTGPDAVPPPPPHADYPSPPPNAIPYNNNGMCTPIYYNQTVVLQCLVSGVVSPPLIIRKVEQGTTVVGGGLMEGVKGIPDHYCAPGEVCGDPVSQLHKIALEVFDPSNASRPIHHVLDPSHPGQSGSFLSCMGEKVNTYRPSEDRQWNGHHADSSESSEPSVPGSPLLTSPTSTSGPDYFGSAAISNDGGRVKTRTKRNSLNAGPKITSKGRRRMTSASTGSTRQNSASETTMTSGALWSVDVGETAVWTVVGTDIARYDFFIPPSSPYGAAPVGYPANGDGSSTPSSMLSSPPSSLTQPITPMPLVAKYLPPERASELPKMPGSGRGSLHHHHHHHHSTKMDGSNGAGVGKMLTVYGENFNKSDPVTVYFGSEPSPHTEVRCAEVINCLPPQSVVQQQQQQMASGSPAMIYPRPIVLVRNDGVVFPTKVMYP